MFRKCVSVVRFWPLSEGEDSLLLPYKKLRMLCRDLLALVFYKQKIEPVETVESDLEK